MQVSALGGLHRVSETGRNAAAPVVGYCFGKETAYRLRDEAASLDVKVTFKTYGNKPLIKFTIEGPDSEALKGRMILISSIAQDVRIMFLD